MGATFFIVTVAESRLNAAMLNWTFESQVPLEFNVTSTDPFTSTSKIGKFTGSFATDGSYTDTTGAGVHQFTIQQFNTLFWDDDISDAVPAINLADHSPLPRSGDFQQYSSTPFHWDQQNQVVTTAPLMMGGASGPSRIETIAQGAIGPGVHALTLYLAFEDQVQPSSWGVTSGFSDLLNMSDAEFQGVSFLIQHFGTDYFDQVPLNSTEFTPVPEPASWWIAISLVAIPAVYVRRKNARSSHLMEGNA